MTVLVGAGGYVPLYRIERNEIARQYGGGASGETAVPARDETVLTMATEAAGRALSRADIDGPSLNAVFSASVTDPYAEHGIAAHVAYRFGAEGDLRTGDFRGSSRAATDAFAAGRHFVGSTGGTALVVATDVLPVEPGHDDEPYSGAGAGAVVLSGDSSGGSRSFATVHGIGTHTSGFVERHRQHGLAANSGDRRFEGQKGFGGSVPAAVQYALEVAEAPPASAVVAAPDQRMVRGAIAELPGEVEHVSTFDSVGYAATASFFLDLVHLLESGDAGTSAVAVNYGAGGADAVALTVGNGGESGVTVADQLDAKEYVTYGEHLRFRERPTYQGVSVE